MRGGSVAAIFSYIENREDREFIQLMKSSLNCVSLQGHLDKGLWEVIK